MDSGARNGYAHSRLSARHGRRLTAGDWRRLEASQDFDHLLDLVRSTPLVEWVRTVAPTTDIHALETALRDAWGAACREVAAWYPPAWQPALAWIGWLPWVPLVESLAQREAPPAWLGADPVFGGLTDPDPARCLAALERSPLAPLLPEWRAGGGCDAGWRRVWRGLWPAVASRRERQLLLRLDSRLAGGAWTGRAGSPLPAPALRSVAEHDVTRLFRLAGVGPAAAAAWLILRALDHIRLRGLLARVRQFGAGSRA